MFSRRIWERWTQHHLSTTRNLWYPQKGTVFSGDCCRLRKGELPLQALPVATPIAADECDHHPVAYTQKKTTTSWSQSPLSQALDTVFNTPAAWPGLWRWAAEWVGTQEGPLHSQGFLAWHYRYNLIVSKLQHNNNKTIQNLYFQLFPMQCHRYCSTQHQVWWSCHIRTRGSHFNHSKAILTTSGKLSSNANTQVVQYVYVQCVQERGERAWNSFKLKNSSHAFL